MISYKIAVGIGALIATAALAIQPLAALSLRECSAAYKTARTQGSLAGMSWQDFRRAKCGTAAATATRAGATGKAEGKTGGQAAASPATGSTAAPAPGGSGYLPTGRMVLPNAIPPKYANAVPGKARRQTCLDQYRLNKASDANGGLKWVQKGGGYYSECNKRLKEVRKQ
jgi:hypothetical protein